MRVVTPADFTAQVRATPDCYIEADSTFGLQYLVVAGRTIAVAALETVDVDGGRSA